MFNKKLKVISILTFVFIFAISFFIISYDVSVAEGKLVLKKTGLPPAKDKKYDYKTIRVHMVMEAGYDFYEVHPGGKRTIHAGQGRIDPFGVGSYVAGIGYPEQKKYPMPDYFNKTWMKQYNTGLFCIYKLKGGNIFAYDGITGSLEPNIRGTYVRSDYLMNVIVGGTGKFKGATGMLLGRTMGAGDAAEVAPGLILPKSIIKDMEGYITIPK